MRKNVSHEHTLFASAEDLSLLKITENKCA